METAVAPAGCPLCAKPSELRQLGCHVDSGVSYTLLSCPACGGQFWEPLRNPGAAWYEADERYAGANANPPREPNINHRATVRLVPGPGRLLDVGCGTGNFMSWAKANGWEVHGIDFDRNAIHAATEVFGLPNVEEADLGTYVTRHPELAGSFDLVTFFDVFEHIDNHRQFASQVSSLLKPCGAVAMSMPYRGGARWLQPNDLPPRHLTRWGRRSLQRFWESQGYRVEHAIRTPASVYFIALKLKGRFGRRLTFNAVSKLQARPSGQGRAAVSGTTLRLLRAAARAKDLALFGLPALAIWLVLLPSRRRYVGLYMVARRTV